MSTAAPTAPENNGKRRRTLLGIVLVFAVLGVAWGLYWLLVLSKRERTDDAYVGGDQVPISTQVSGTVVAVLAANMDLVQAGQVLVRLDPVDAANNLQKAGSALALTVRQFRQTQQQAEQFDALVQSSRLELERLQTDLSQREPLLAQQAVSAEELRHAQSAVQTAKFALTQAQRQAAAAHALIDGADVRDSPTVLQARTAYVEAWIAAQRNVVVAPVTGHVGQRTAQIGQHVQPGQTLMIVVPLDELWVDANFKEVQLRKLRIGQPAEVDADVYGGGATFHGRVRGIAPGTGAAFALLPAQNASGNWIKVVQRVPVRIQLDSKDLKQHPLRIGMSTTVTVDIQDQSGPMVANEYRKLDTPDSPIYSRDLAQAQAQAGQIIERNLQTP